MRALLYICMGLAASLAAVAQSRGPGATKTIPPMTIRLPSGEQERELTRLIHYYEVALERVEQQMRAAGEHGTKADALESERTRLEAEYRSLIEYPDPEWTMLVQTVLEPRLAGLDRFRSAEAGLGQAQARELLAEFYVDLGHPSLNYRYLTAGLLPVVEQLATEPGRLHQPARTAMLEGLLEYAALATQEGRHLASPYTQAMLAGGILSLSRAGDEGALRRAEELYYDAVAWAGALDRDEDLETIEQQVGWRIEAAQELALEELSSGAPGPSDEGARLLDEQLRAGVLDPGTVEELYGRIAAPGADDERAILRFLTFCRRALGSRPARTRPEIVSAINAALLRLGREGRLTSPKLWRHWAETVRHLRGQASPELRTFIAERLEQESSAALKRVLAGTYAAVTGGHNAAHRR